MRDQQRILGGLGEGEVERALFLESWFSCSGSIGQTLAEVMQLGYVGIGRIYSREFGAGRGHERAHFELFDDSGEPHPRALDDPLHGAVRTAVEESATVAAG